MHLAPAETSGIRPFATDSESVTKGKSELRTALRHVELDRPLWAQSCRSGRQFSLPSTAVSSTKLAKTNDLAKAAEFSCERFTVGPA